MKDNNDLKRIIFVGMHNKPEKKALDSSTMTGKIVDKIIDKVPAKCECVKTNLCDIDYLPKDKQEIWEWNLNWIESNNPSDNTIIALLGRWVQKHFIFAGCKQINLTHPAGIFGTTNKQKYVKDAVNQKIFK